MPAVKRRLSPIFLILFAWLQCLAPLLHAHASAEDHAGVHLPEWSLAQGYHGDGPAWVDTHQGHDHAVIALASSIEPRQDARLSPGTQPVLPGWLSVGGRSSGHVLAPPTVPDAGDLRFSYLVPDACAPPHA